jgi:DNA-directed RNA polymerase I and III subunit RPAC2
MTTRPRASSTHSQDEDHTGGKPDNAMPKISILEQSNRDKTWATFIIRNEDHTLGNVLRDIAMKNENINMAAYNVPHPLERDIHVRIETNDKTTAKQAMKKTCQDLISQCDFINTLTQAKLQ